MTPEELVEEILSLSRAEQARLFNLLRERPALRRYLGAEPEPATSAKPAPAPPAPRALDSSCDYLLIFDGGSKGNPGKGYGSYALYRTDTGRGRVERLEFPGLMTNNEAEYQTLITALETLLGKIREHGRDPQAFSIEVRGDSQLVILQVLGKWRAKDERMAVYRDRVRALLARFGRYELKHQLRDKSVDVLGH